MLRAILSKKELSEYGEYYGCVSDLLCDKSVLSLKDFRHHIATTRFQHSLNVSYYNFRLCKLMRLDARAAARAGLLHDFFLYNRKSHKRTERSHAEEHSKTALKNASERFPLSELERDMIVNHMWPMTPKIPRHRETFVITLVDKFCAVAEVTAAACRYTKTKVGLASGFVAAMFLNLHK